jgi:dolichol-phosphate mannosyltransferase
MLLFPKVHGIENLMLATLKKTVIMVPTYNEKGNISRLIEEIMALKVPGNELHVLVVDDNSPDGTSQVVAEIAAKNPRVKIITRTQQRGRGSAGIHGFREALASGADYVIEMDADFSHHPRYLPELIAAAENGADVVLGSRFVKGGADKDRGTYRQTVTKLAGFYVRSLLKLKIRDVSSGYRCFKRSALEQLDLDNLISTGPSIVLEILFKSVMKGMKITEVPIVFIDRRQGETKLNWITLLETLVMVLRLRDLKQRGQLFRLQ